MPMAESPTVKYWEGSILRMPACIVKSPPRLRSTTKRRLTVEFPLFRMAKAPSPVLVMPPAPDQPPSVAVGEPAVVPRVSVEAESISNEPAPVKVMARFVVPLAPVKRKVPPFAPKVRALAARLRPIELEPVSAMVFAETTPPLMVVMPP